MLISRTATNVSVARHYADAMDHCGVRIVAFVPDAHGWFVMGQAEDEGSFHTASEFDRAMAGALCNRIDEMAQRLIDKV